MVEKSGPKSRKGSASGVFNRRRFLRLGGVGLAGAALLGTVSLVMGSTFVSAPRLGISKTNTASQNRAGLINALTNFSKSVTFPPGDYLVDNSGSYIVIENFQGELTMEPGARFVFTDRTTRGLTFEGGEGARFHGLSSTFKALPPERIYAEECISFWRTSDTVVENADVRGSAAAGLLFGECIRPSVTGATIRHTMADGLHFANCRDARADRILTEDTGDDGLAYLNYLDGPDYSGGRATNITVKRSRARGIAVVGQSNVTVEGFSVDATRAGGLYCAYEASWNTRVPGDVVFKNGSTSGGGELGGTPGSNYGITIDQVESVEFADVKVISPATRGVSSHAPAGTVRLYGVEVHGAREEGFNLQAASYHLDRLTTTDAGGTGFYVADSPSVRYGRLSSINSSKASGLHHAASFERNALVRGEELVVADDQATPTGYVVHASGSQDGTLGVIHDRVAGGEVQIVNSSSSLAHGLTAR